MLAQNAQYLAEIGAERPLAAHSCGIKVPPMLAQQLGVAAVVLAILGADGYQVETRCIYGDDKKNMLL